MRVLPAPFAIAASLVCLAACGAPEGPHVAAFIDGSAAGPSLEREAADDTVREWSHQVRVHLMDGVAHLDVVRILGAPAGEPGEWSVPVGLPDGATVTGFAAGGSEPRWAGALLDRGAAAERFAQLAAPGDAPPSPVALLDRGPFGPPSMTLFGFAPGDRVATRLAVVAPLVYEAGWRVIRYPRCDSTDGEPGATPKVRVDPGPEVGMVVVDDAPSDDDAEACGNGRCDDDPCRDIRVRIAPTRMDAVMARYAVRPLASDRSIGWLEIDLAPELEPAPAGAHVVFAVDASHSAGEAGIRASLEVARGYLANLHDARVEVVLFRRRAERLFGRFVPAGDLARALSEVAPERLAPGNGSHLDAAAHLAAEALRDASGPARIVFLTDGRVRRAFDPTGAGGALARALPGAVAHVALVDGADATGELEAERADEHALAEFASATGGVVFAYRGTTGEPAAAAAATIELVRPTRIDAFAIEADGAPEAVWEAPAQMREGESLRRAFVADRVPVTATLRGYIWARPFERTLGPDSGLGVQLPALALGHELSADLDDAEVTELALAAGALSRTTSFLAAAPDARPSVAGTGTLRGSAFGYSTMCGCSGVGIADVGYGMAVRAPADAGAWLRALVAPGADVCARRLGVRSGSTTLRVETTGDEVVDVEVQRASTACLGACVEEAVWAARLDERFDRFDFDVAVEVPATGGRSR